ncbi:MAG: HEPN domain-containing protein [Thermofilaceae archaeon]
MREEALDWLESSLVDLREAWEAHSRGSYHLSVFLAHQAVGKALKAYIIAFGRVRPPRTHDLVELAAAAEIQLDSSEIEGLSELSPYFVVARHPNAGLRKPWKEITQGTSQKLLTTAERIAGKIEALFRQAQQG